VAGMALVVIMLVAEMPASSSSPIHLALGHLADLAGAAAEDPTGRLAVLARVVDPRHQRGVRHRLAVILALAVCGAGRGTLVQRDR
jgi:hypothetical protein